MLEETALESRGLSILGGIWDSAEHSCEQPSLADPALSEGIGIHNLHKPLPTFLPCDSVSKNSPHEPVTYKSFLQIATVTLGTMWLSQNLTPAYRVLHFENIP